MLACFARYYLYIVPTFVTSVFNIVFFSVICRLLSLESGVGYEDLMLTASVVVGSLLGTNGAGGEEMSSLTEVDRLHVAQLAALWRDATTKIDLVRNVDYPRIYD